MPTSSAIAPTGGFGDAVRGTKPGHTTTPGTGTPEPGGLTPREAFPLIRRLCAEVNVIGFDLVELLAQPLAPVLGGGLGERAYPGSPRGLAVEVPPRRLEQSPPLVDVR